MAPLLVSGGNSSVCSRRRSGGDGFLLPRRPPVVADMGCGCEKASRMLGSLFSSLTCRPRGGGASKAKPAPHAHASSSSVAFTPSATAATSATTVSSSVDSWGPATYTTNALYEDVAEARRQLETRRKRRRRRSSSGTAITRREKQGSRRKVDMARGAEEAAVAVEVDSAAPYEDFRDSMVAMVVEKEMYAWEDLNALLHGFLSLNSPRHHPLIVHAFADLWTPAAGIFYPPSPCPGL